MRLDVPIFHVWADFTTTDPSAVTLEDLRHVFHYTTDEPTRVAMYFEEREGAELFAEQLADMLHLLGIPCRIRIVPRTLPSTMVRVFYLEIALPYRLRKEIIEKNVKVEHEEDSDVWTVKLAGTAQLWSGVNP